MGGNPMNEKVGIKNFRIDVQYSIPPSPLSLGTLTCYSSSGDSLVRLDPVVTRKLHPLLTTPTKKVVHHGILHEPGVMQADLAVNTQYDNLDVPQGSPRLDDQVLVCVLLDPAHQALRDSMEVYLSCAPLGSNQIHKDTVVVDPRTLHLAIHHTHTIAPSTLCKIEKWVIMTIDTRKRIQCPQTLLTVFYWHVVRFTRLCPCMKIMQNFRFLCVPLANLLLG